MAGTASTGVKADTELLAGHAEEITALTSNWEGKAGAAEYIFPEIGECGGTSIIDIEQLGIHIQTLQDTMAELFKMTAKYMNNVITQIDTDDTKAEAKIKEQ